MKFDSMDFEYFIEDVFRRYDKPKTFIQSNCFIYW